MKILIVTPRFYPETFSPNIFATELANKGHDVTILTGRPFYGKETYYSGYEKYNKFDEYKNVKIIRVNTKVSKTNFFAKALNYLSSGKLFKKELKKLNQDFDAVLSFALSPLFAISYTNKFCRKHKIPSLLYGLDIWPESFVAGEIIKKESLSFKILKLYSKRLYKKFDYITYSSPNAIKYIKNYLKVDKPSEVIYQPCLNEGAKTSSRHEYKKDGFLHILYCGTTAKFTHLDLMLHALAKTKGKKKIVFDIVGSGHDDKILVDLKQKYNLANVIVHGRVSVEETFKFYENSDILFVPLYYNCETSKLIPQKVIEYLLYSRPILGMLKGDGRELLSKASSGNYFVDQSPDDIANKLDELLDVNPSYFEKTGLENRRYFDSNANLHSKNIVERIESILIELINQRKAN